MKPTARFINVGRGGLVVPEDLESALVEGEIAGAALDVFAAEPLATDSPLWKLPGVIVSPHMSGDVVGWRERLRQLFIDNFERFTTGRPLRNVVDKRLGYVPSDPAGSGGSDRPDTPDHPGAPPPGSDTDRRREP
jgi:phosphoglycerate dehydrogenase-like enzyme